jgi:hypothetical protein
VRGFRDGRRYLPANPQRRGQGFCCPDLLRRGLISGIPGTQSAAGADFFSHTSVWRFVVSTDVENVDYGEIAGYDFTQ